MVMGKVSFLADPCRYHAPASGEPRTPIVHFLSRMYAVTDANAEQYTSRMSVQSSPGEVIEDLENMCVHLFGRYREAMGKHPKRILFYRNGSSPASEVHRPWILGSSKPAHYNVLLDENNFTTDGMQSLSHALCHVYARCTRSVSYPAPILCTHNMCMRAKNHYDPQAGQDLFQAASDVVSTAPELALALATRALGRRDSSKRVNR
ncbi:hypothetical protein V8E53_011656 [Lactarius tabidus]